MSAAKAGTVMLTLKLSASGKAALAKAGALKVNLNIEFSPANGKPANQSVPLTLKR